jgi:uncharacterized protein (DUF2062 family)
MDIRYFLQRKKLIITVYIVDLKQNMTFLMMNNNFFKTTYNKVLGILKQGTAPHELSLTIAISISMGLIPLLGVNSAACAAIAIIWRLNVPLMQLLMWVFFPLQLFLYMKFFGLASFIFQREVFSMTFAQLWQLFKVDWLLAIQKFAMGNLFAIAAWAIFAIPLTLAVYYISRGIIAQCTKSKQAAI